MKELTKVLRILLSISFVLIVSCRDNHILNESVEDSDSLLVVSAQTRAVIPYDFDWENIDWMPTPPGQNILVPWAPGPGSLLTTYDLDVLNDHKSTDGWVLIYNSFDPNSTRDLVNPFFVLYNKYRGLIRFYIYFTTPFMVTSKNLCDIISIDRSTVSYYPTTLGYTGTLYQELDKIYDYSRQIQPAPKDGSSPVNTYRWYMCEYELAYDPRIYNDDILLKWNLNYSDVIQYHFGGNYKGSINGTIGSSAKTSNPLSDILNGAVKATGQGIIGLGSEKIIKDIKEDKMGLGTEVALSVFQGFASVATGNYTTFIKGIANMVFGGSSGTTAQSVNLKVGGELTLDGTGTTYGSLPSMGLSFWLPSKNISSGTLGTTPLYNYPLGVIGITSTPQYGPGRYVLEQAEMEDPYDGHIFPYTIVKVYPKQLENKHRLIFNEEVLKIADIRILREDLVYIARTRTIVNGKVVLAGQIIEGNDVPVAEGNDSSCWEYGWFCNEGVLHHKVNGLCARFFIEIRPRNGTPPIILTKTFQAEYDGTDLGKVSDYL